MIKGGLGFEHRLGCEGSVLWLVVYCGFVRKEKGEEDEQGESGHVLEVAAAVRQDVHQE